MKIQLNTYLDQLLATLGQIRRRLHREAKQEVAQALAEAFHSLTHEVICGASPRSFGNSPSQWNDPWEDFRQQYWDQGGTFASLGTSSHQEKSRSVPRIRTAVIAGLGVIRWSYSHSGKVVPALALGIGMILAVLLGGSVMTNLLDAASSATSLILLPSPSLDQ